jgi:hypothetical protein
MDQERRQFLRNSGIVLSIAVAGEVLLLSPAQARAAGLPFQRLSAQEVSTLEAMAEAVVPGARKAGIAQYIDKQLAASHEESLLMLKYLGVPQSDCLSFYQGGLRSAAALSHSRFGKGWPELESNEADELVAEIAGKQQPGEWEGPPASFFFFVIRSDASDVVYGSEEGFAAIGMPYMAHIAPPEPW